jgi:hypothetical protein
LPVTASVMPAKVVIVTDTLSGAWLAVANRHDREG